MSEEIYHGHDPTKNNVVYQSKHYYAFMLKELKTIKAEVENEVKQGSADQKKLTEIYETYQRVIVGLIREGADFQYIKNQTAPENSIIRLKVDNIEYECLNTSIRNILKDDYQQVMGFPYDGPEIEYENNIATQQLNAAVKESLSQENNNFHIVPSKFIYENAKKKRYLKRSIIDVIEVIVILFLIKILFNNPIFNNMAKEVYMSLQGPINTIMTFISNLFS